MFAVGRMFYGIRKNERIAADDEAIVERIVVLDAGCMVGRT